MAAKFGWILQKIACPSIAGGLLYVLIVSKTFPLPGKGFDTVRTCHLPLSVHGQAIFCKIQPNFAAIDLFLDLNLALNLALSF